MGDRLADNLGRFFEGVEVSSVRSQASEQPRIKCRHYPVQVFGRAQGSVCAKPCRSYRRNHAMQCNSALNKP